MLVASVNVRMCPFKGQKKSIAPLSIRSNSRMKLNYWVEEGDNFIKL
jgi:hypothetical protein